jgi:hypothetical protein
MLSDWELWACANEMTRQHDGDAPIHAAMRADALFDDGDFDGAANWRAIVSRINELLVRPSGPLH